MQTNHYLSKIFRIILLLLGCVLGVGVGVVISVKYWPPWHREAISTDDYAFKEIIYVRFYSTTDDPSGDRLIVSTEKGNLYSLSQNQWQLIEALPTETSSPNFFNLDNTIGTVTTQGQVFLLRGNQWILDTDEEIIQRYREQIPCATRWQDFPRVKQPVIDSDGIQFEHPIANFSRCYVLLSDGTLLLFTKQSNVFDAWTVIGISALGGLLLSGITQFAIRRYKIARDEPQIP